MKHIDLNSIPAELYNMPVVIWGGGIYRETHLRLAYS